MAVRAIGFVAVLSLVSAAVAACGDGAPGHTDDPDAAVGSPDAETDAPTSDAPSPTVDAHAEDDGAVADAADVDAPDVSDAADAADAVTDAADASDAAAGPVVTPAASDVRVYVGQTALLDATGTTVVPSATPAFSWTLASKPAGSALTNASLAGAATATPSFAPDALGTYTLALEVTAGTTKASLDVHVDAVDVTTFALYSDVLDGGATPFRTGIRAFPIYADGGARDLSCHALDASSAAWPPYVAGFAADVWEGPAGTDAKIAYAVPSLAGPSLPLYVVSANASCAAPPVLLPDAPALQPRFSPSGERLAYMIGATNHVVTVATDGSDRRDVASYAQADSGAPVLVSPRWRSASEIGWIVFEGAPAWRVVVAQDTANATPDAVMTCASLDGSSAAQPHEFAFLADGSILVAMQGSGTVTASGVSSDLLVFRPNANTKQCELVRALTTGGGVESFALSPDQRTVAFARRDPASDGGLATPLPESIWTVPVDGSRAAAPLAGVPDAGAMRFGGPRFLGAGSLLVWSHDRSVLGLGPADGGATEPALVVAPSDGGALRVVATSRPDDVVISIGTGQGCAIAGASGSGFAFAGALGGLGWLFVRRRKARART